MKLSVNLNDEIEFRLTSRGYWIAWEYYKNLGVSFPAKFSQSGSSRCTLWEAIHIFGEHIHIGCDVPFENNEIFFKIN